MIRGGTYVRKLSEEQKREVIDLYQAGNSLTAIALRFSMDRTSIHSLLVRRGIPRRPPSSFRRYTLNEAAFDVVTPESAYWAGFIMADGNIGQTRGNPTLVVQLAEKDASHLVSLQAFLGSTRPILRVPPRSSILVCGRRVNSQTHLWMCVHSQKIADALAKFGVVPRKSLTAEVIGLEMNRHFWRGVIDGDGSVGCRPPRNRWLEPTLQLIGSERLMCQFSAFVHQFTNARASVIRRRSIYRVRLSGHGAFAVIRVLYSDCSVALARKLALAQTILSNPPLCPPQK